MTKFIIQTNEGRPLKFGFVLEEAVDYFEWYHKGSNYYSSERLEDFEDFEITIEKLIPVGSIEFVKEFTEKVYDSKIKKPINIPEELMTDYFLKRKVYLDDGEIDFPVVINGGDSIFIKDKHHYKGYTRILGIDEKIPKGVIISEFIDIETEYRVFVFNRKLRSINRYLGNPRVFPSISLIDRAIKEYKNCPPAYTLDVAVTTDGETCVIEVHPFVSCGLYGFQNLGLLPPMMQTGYEWIKEG